MAKNASLPLCPACGRNMGLTRVFDREYAGYQLNSFECQPCGVTYTRAAYDEQHTGEAGPTRPKSGAP
jgi:hypothetical protein